jgi:hypothetical protein
LNIDRPIANSGEEMIKVFLHHKEGSEEEWVNEDCEFTRIPCIGEYVALSSKSLWYRVYAVVHCPFEEAEIVAEVYLSPPSSTTSVIAAEKPLPY